MQLHRARKDFEAAGAGLVLIGQATPRQAAHFRRRMEIELPVLADDRRVTYKAIGAKQASLGELLGPRIVAKGLLTSARTGVVQGRTVGSPTQLGGVLVILPGDEVAWSHLSADASDNASPKEILEHVRARR